MVYKIKEIIRDVRIAIDENMESEQLISDGDIETLSLDTLIRSKIEEGARRVIKSAPADMLEEGHQLDDAVFWNGDGSGFILLPDDYVRLVVFKMSDWERAVYEPLRVTDVRYQLQHSRYKGIRGNKQKPMVVYVNRPEGKALEFYSCGSEDAFMELGQYIPKPYIDCTDGIDISEDCYNAVVYMTAGLLLMAYGEIDKANILIELSKGLLE